MFGKAKLQPVIEPTEAVKILRERFDRSIKTGKLKVEGTETVLVDIRQTLVQCDASKNRILKEVDKAITDLIKTLKERKAELLSQVDSYFAEERDKIASEEQKWRERQRICEDLLKMASRKDADQEILLRSKYISDGLDQLEERLKFNEIKLINSIDGVLHIKDDQEKEINISSNDLNQLFKQYL